MVIYNFVINDKMIRMLFYMVDYMLEYGIVVIFISLIVNYFNC